MILIDPPTWPAHGRRWSHVASDTSLRELHAFASAVGIPERAFEGDHYDVPEDRYAQTVRAGAVPVSGRELLRRLQASGLRRSKRRGERVLASRFDDVGGHRVDTVLSALPPLGPVARVHVVLVHAGHLLVAPDGEGYLLPAAPVPAGEPFAEVARRLAGRLLGPPRASSACGQVGYLRRVPHGRNRPIGFEVVLRWPDPAPPDAARALVTLPPAGAAAGDGPDGATSGGAAGDALLWVPARWASALLPVDLAPVALHEHHRLRPGHGPRANGAVEP